MKLHAQICIKMRNIVSILIVGFAFIAGAVAQEVRVTASAPGTVIMGRPFQVRYTVNARATDFRAPAITNFDILAGPFKSESQSTQIVNGNVNTTFSVTYTYTLQPQKEGTFNIPSATVIVNDERHTSTGLTIRVLPPDENSESQPRQSSQNQPAATEINPQNIFIRPILSRTNVYQQEAVKLTYKLYTTYDIVQFGVKQMPNFNGFLQQEVERTGNTQLAYENYNGRNFLTAVLHEIILFPQSSGEITIDRAVFEAIIRVHRPRQGRSIFDEFFETYSNIPHQVEVPAIRLNVKKLPDGKPNNFSGVLGTFSINTTISANELTVNDALTLKVNISGSGNMRMLVNPDFKFPESFDVFDPKVTNQFRPSAQGLTGTKSVEYTIIPRHSGDFEIPATEMMYFSPTDGAYKTLRTPAFNIRVLKSDGTVDPSPVVSSFSAKENVRQLGDDIRYIYTASTKLSRSEVFHIEQLRLWLLLFVLPFILALAIFVLLRKHVKESADIELVKNKKANRIAVKRLKQAARHLKAGEKEKFYAEVMNAVWTYLSDKLIIPVAELNRERVQDSLNKREIDVALINRLTEVIDTCEFARFAPSGGQQEMGNLFEETVYVISSIERSIRK